MPKSPRTSGTSTAKVPAFPSGQGVAALETSVRRLAHTRKWDIQRPLPTTREIGQLYGISNASVSRLLNRLHEEGTIWRRDNGRYFLNESRSLLERRKPYGCLLRQLQSWSRVYQDVMSGFSRAFGSDRASMLFVHDERLVRHTDTSQPPVHASAAEQRESLTELFRHHADEFRGILLDEVWRDDVLGEFSGQLENAVVVCRPTALPGLSSVCTDFEAGALLAISHLYARGFEEVRLAIPFQGAASIGLWEEAALRAAALIGQPIDQRHVHSVATPAERKTLIASLRSAPRRAGIFCLEDNMSLLLHQEFTAAGLNCPGRIGLLSAMGTELATRQGISSLQVDFEKLGQAAGDLLVHRKLAKLTVAPGLFVGDTT